MFFVGLIRLGDRVQAANHLEIDFYSHACRLHKRQTNRKLTAFLSYACNCVMRVCGAHVIVMFSRCAYNNVFISECRDPCRTLDFHSISNEHVNLFVFFINLLFNFQNYPEHIESYSAISMESRCVPWILQQLSITHACNIAGTIANDGVGHNCELGEKGRRQTEWR